MFSNRVSLLRKMIIKACLFIVGYIIVTAELTSQHRIFMPCANMWELIWALITALPVKEALGYFKDQILFFGFHGGTYSVFCVICGIAFIPFLWTLLIHGLRAGLKYTADHSVITYVYKDTGEFAYDEFDPTGVILGIISFMIRVVLCWFIIELAPAILLLSLAINAIQLIWPFGHEE